MVLQAPLVQLAQPGPQDQVQLEQQVIKALLLNHQHPQIQIYYGLILAYREYKDWVLQAPLVQPVQQVQ